MGLLQYYCNDKFNAVLLSKLTVKRLKNYPELKCFLLYFIIATKKYKKNLLLFYLTINLILGGVFFFKKKNVGPAFVLSVSVKKKEMAMFLHAFINSYLPLSNLSENLYKQTVSLRKKNLTGLFFFRFYYFSFPAIAELDLFYDDFELVYDFITGFKFQLDVVIKNSFLFLSAGEVLLRMHKFPCSAKQKLIR